MNKKATNIYWVGVIFFIIVFTGFAFIKNKQELKSITFPIGHQANILSSMQKQAELNRTIDNALIRLIQSDSKRLLYLNGGFSESNYGKYCGNIDNYNLWLNNDQICIPKIYSEFMHLMENNIKKRLSKDYIVSIINKSNSIQTYAIAKKDINIQKESIQYKINPSLSIPLSLNSKQFQEISKFVLEAQKCKKDDCVQDLIKKYKISDDCEEGSEKVKSKFFDDYQKCLNSYDLDCTCNISLPNEKGEYLFIFENNTINFSNHITTYAVNTSKTYYNSVTNPNIIKMLYLSTGTSQKYKLNINGNSKSLNELKMYKGFDNSLAIMLNKDPNLKQCRIYKTYDYKLCSKVDDELLFNLDKESTNTKHNIRFGIRIKKQEVPEPVEILNIKDKEFAEDKIELTFKNNNEHDVMFYRIYYSTTDYTNIDNATLFTEIFDNKQTSTKVDINLEDNIKYFVSVTAVDVYDNENKEVTTKSITPIDDVAPAAIEDLDIKQQNIDLGGTYIVSPKNTISLSWNEQKYNENEELANDIFGYYIYYSPLEFSALPLDLTKESCIKMEGCIFTTKTSYTITGLEEKDYYVKVSAVDTSGNYNGKSVGKFISKPTNDLIWPANGPLSSCYGWRDLGDKRDWTDGIDIALRPGTEVKAVADGIVYYTCSNPQNTLKDKSKRRCQGFGSNVIIYHPHLKTYSRYSHLSMYNVKKTDKITQGEVIGFSGNSGHSYGPHLDFKYYLTENFRDKPNNFDENPLCFLPAKKLTFTKNAKSCTADDDLTAIQLC